MCILHELQGAPKAYPRFVELHAPVEALRKLRDGGDGWPFSSSVSIAPIRSWKAMPAWDDAARSHVLHLQTAL